MPSNAPHIPLGRSAPPRRPQRPTQFNLVMDHATERDMAAVMDAYGLRTRSDAVRLALRLAARRAVVPQDGPGAEGVSSSTP